MPVTLFLSQKVMLVCGTHSSLQWRKKLIIYLQQDGKTAEDLAKSEQHEHVAGLLTRLRKVRNFVLWNALCFLCEKFCLVPYNRWKWTLCWTHRWYQKAPVLGCGLLISLHKCVGYLSGFFFCIRTWKSLACFCSHCARFSSSHPVYNTCPLWSRGEMKKPTLLLSFLMFQAPKYHICSSLSNIMT